MNTDSNALPNLGLRKRMLVNTISNYGKMIISILVSIFLTRILFLGLSREEYGFWALLWSIFGYSLLLDFGFGTAVQKYTSECSVKGEWERYNRIVSTVFFTYAMFASLIAVFAVLLSFNLERIFGFSSTNAAYFQKVTILFGLGSALCFPFGFFTEVLRGLQKMHTRNIIQTSFIVLNFVGMAVMIHLKVNLTGMVFVALGTNLLSSLTMMIVVHRLIPSFRIRPSLYDKSLLRSVMGFSLFAYLITFTNLIILKTDQLVISIFGSVAMVAVYQISIRLADTYQKFSGQFLDNLGPVSASLFAAGNKNKMAEIILQSNRLMGMISTMLVLPLLVFIKPLLNIWLNLDHQAGMICAILLLISMYVLLFFRSSSVYVLLMANEHRILSFVAAFEAIANLGLSIFLIKSLPGFLVSRGIHIPDAGIIGVALGTLIPNLLLAIFFNIPKACRFASIRIREYFRIVVAPTLITGIFTLGFAFLLYYIHYPARLLMVMLYIILSVIFFLALTWKIGLLKWERKQVLGFLESKLKKHR